MEADKHILDKVDHKDGLTVPEGYFADFVKQMAASLPENDLESSQSESTLKAPRTLWHRIRPYVYMAAMSPDINVNILSMHHTPANMAAIYT